MHLPKFHNGQNIKLAPLEPFECDILAPRFKEARGTVWQVFSKQFVDMDGCHYVYEVLWKWPNGETCVAHYSEDKLELD